VTVQEVIDALSQLSPVARARKFGIWMPGSVIDVTGPEPMVFHGHTYDGYTLLEGNVRPGSALGRD
jgi:hypothetical protein